MARALWKNTVIAESSETVVVEGNHYFPPGSVNLGYLRESDRRTVCPWKGTASYYTIEIDGERSEDAAWVYRDPKEAAGRIKDHIAFWRDVTVEP